MLRRCTNTGQSITEINFSRPVDPCERVIKERRTRIKMGLFYSFFKNQRNGIRRSADPQHNYYVDTHEPSLLALVLGILGLCIADVYFSLLLFSYGAEEANPFMAVLLEYSIELFFGVKLAITFICLAVLLTLKHYRVFKHISGYHLLYLCLFFYISLVGYEIALLVQRTPFIL